MEHNYGIHIPEEILKDFSSLIKETAERLGKELTVEEILELYKKEYPQKVANKK